MNAARYWLGRARGINREIETLQAARAEARDQLLKITQNYDTDGAQSTKNPHKFDRLVELENILDQKIDELIDVKAEITEAISKLEDGRQRSVLISYYVRCKTLEEIAVELHYSYRSIKKFHRAGILEIEKSLPTNAHTFVVL